MSKPPPDSETVSPRAPLAALAERLGLYREYTSAAGETVDVSDQTLRALAAALGFPADTDEQAQRSLDSFDAAGDGRHDAVLVSQEGSAVETLWHGDAAGPIDWRIVLESGDQRRGRAIAQPAAGHSLGVPLDGVPIGYHRLELRAGGVVRSARLIVVPRRAWLPEAWETASRRDWAVTAQLYSLRSQHNWGIGDFGDLGRLGQMAAELGASAVGLNPLHALFPANPRHISPYSPSSRAFLNPIYIDVEAVPEYASCPAAQARVGAPDFQRRLRAAREAEFVDHASVWSMKREVLQALHDRLRDERTRAPHSARAREFAAFKSAGATALQRFATFEALQAHFFAAGKGLAWRDWPAAYRDADSAEVAGFAAENEKAVEFSQFLQWEADRQLGAQAEALRAAGMTTGLYRDVAVGVDPNGAEAWGDPTLLVSSASVGAPPDLYNPIGQDWGLTPFNPVALRQRDYEPFIAAIRANMRHAGAIRIDHVIGLQRLYWVPRGQPAKAGGYIAYPYEHLMGIIALESRRHRCFVVGEDLGTVPEGFREDAQRRGLLSYRVLYFEREGADGALLPPARYPELAAAAVSTHDLPTLAGLWSGRDLQWRQQLGLYPSADAAQKEAASRGEMRRALLDALIADGDLSPAAEQRLGSGNPPNGELMTAAHRFLAAAPCRLLLVQLEDLAGEVEQMNLPGTVDEHPNWRRKLRATLEQIFGSAAVAEAAAAIEAARRRIRAASVSAPPARN